MATAAAALVSAASTAARRPAHNAFPPRRPAPAPPHVAAGVVPLPRNRARFPARARSPPSAPRRPAPRLAPRSHSLGSTSTSTSTRNVGLANWAFPDFGFAPFRSGGCGPRRCRGSARRSALGSPEGASESPDQARFRTEGVKKRKEGRGGSRLNSNRVDQPGYEGSVTERVLHIDDKSRMTGNLPVASQLESEAARDAAGGAAKMESEKKSKLWKIRLFDVEMTPDTTAIASVYFVQGVLGLARLAVTFFLKDELHIDPAEASVLMGLSTFPWLIKPLYGFMSDTIPLFGYKRRSYLILCGIVGALSWLTFATVVDSKYTAVACIILSSLSVAVSDVVVDSMVVERARGESLGSAGSLQSLCWGCSAIGGVTSAYFSGSLVQTYGPRFVFGITAILPLITSFAGFLVIENKFSKSYTDDFSPLRSSPDDVIPLSEVGNNPKENRILYSENKKSYSGAFPNVTLTSSPKKFDDYDTKFPNVYVKADSDRNYLLNESESSDVQLVSSTQSVTGDRTKSNSFTSTVINQGIYLWNTIKQPSILLPTLFIFVWQATPQSDTAMFYFMTNRLNFDAEFLGRVRLVTSLASLAGIWIYNSYLKEVDLKKLFLWVTILGTALGLSQLLLVTGANRSLGINDHFFAIGDSLVLTVLGQVSFMPVLVLAARLCPEGVEATLFATLMSISNAAGVTGGLLGALLTQVMGVTSTDFDRLWLLILLCNVSSLLPLPFLHLLPPSEKEAPKNEDLESQSQQEA